MYTAGYGSFLACNRQRPEGPPRMVSPLRGPDRLGDEPTAMTRQEAAREAAAP